MSGDLLLTLGQGVAQSAYPLHSNQQALHFFQAMGRWLLLGLEASTGRPSEGEFVVCRQLAGGGEYAVLTRARLLCVAAPAGRRWAPTLRWAVALEDLLGVRRCSKLEPIAAGSVPGACH